MSKTRLLAIVATSLCLATWLGCMPQPAASSAKTDAELQAGQVVPAAVDGATLPPELAGLTQDELCQLMCQSMGGLGAEMCKAMHAAGIDMTPMMMDQATLDQLAATVRANQAADQAGEQPAAE